MNEKDIKTISKFLSLVLRHSPETIQLKLDEQGWADVEELMAKSKRSGRYFNREVLEMVVANNDKKRFSFNEDGSRIRANQGHSIQVELGLAAVEPPDYLYHGTVNNSVASIREKGLLKMQRQHVHLSKDKETAIKVGSRRGAPVVLVVRSGHMHKDGFAFYLSDNGVWLTDHVPAKYIEHGV